MACELNKVGHAGFLGLHNYHDTAAKSISRKNPRTMAKSPGKARQCDTKAAAKEELRWSACGLSYGWGFSQSSLQSSLVGNMTVLAMVPEEIILALAILRQVRRRNTGSQSFHVKVLGLHSCADAKGLSRSAFY